MKVGFNSDYIDFNNAFNWSMSRNARYGLAGDLAWNGTYFFTYDDTTGEPLTFPPNTAFRVEHLQQWSDQHYR